MDARIRDGFLDKLPEQIIGELLETYKEAKKNFLLGGHRLQSVEGGRFCEAVIRILESISTGTHTPLGRTLAPMDELLVRFSNLRQDAFPPSVRLHIPRALRVVYDIRNSRDAAHLGDGIDPNIQDATLVCAILDWVMAELVRLHHRVPPKEAQQIVNNLVERKIPLIQDFDGYLKILNPKLPSSDYCLSILYQRNRAGATFTELQNWAPPKMRKNLRRTLSTLTNEKGYLHHINDRYEITRGGQVYVEKSNLLGC